FTQGQTPNLTTPSAGTTINQRNLTFSWSAGSATEFFLSVGTSLDKVANSPWGDIFHTSWGNALSADVVNVPLNGQTLFVRLWYRPNGVQGFKDYTFATTNMPLIPPALTSPATGSTVSQNNVNFTWTKGDATEFFLSVGSSLNQVANSPWGDIYHTN